MKSKKQENNENNGNELKIKDLVAKIKKDLKKVKVLEKSSTELKLKIAKRFVRLQVLVREEGYQWLPFVKKYFKFQSDKSLQRHMKIVKHLDLDKNPNLAAAGLTRLGKLAKIYKKKSLKKILDNYDPSMDSESEKPKSVLKFKKSLDELIKSHKISKKDKTSDRFKEVDKICRDIQKINEQIHNIHTNNKVRNYVTYSHGVNSYFDARDIFDKMEDWFKHFFKEVKSEKELKDTLL